MRKSHPVLRGIEEVSPYRTVSGDSLYLVRPPAMQIDDFLPVGGIMGVTAYPGVGKTWLAMEVARAVAGGLPFLGHYRATRGGVLFVGSDSSLEDYARQWTRLTRATEDAHDRFEPVRFLIQSTFMFEDMDEVRKLIRTHQTFEWGDVHATEDGPERERGFHVIVFDTVSKLTRMNQNDNTEMEEVFRHIRWIAEATNAAVILLHHNAKKSEFNDGSDWRGAIGQIGGLDSWVHLTPKRSDKYLVKVQYKKFRGITPDDFSYRMSVMDAEAASLTVAEKEILVEDEHVVLDALATRARERVQAGPGRRASDIRDDLWAEFEPKFVTRAKLLKGVHNRLNAMLAAGSVRREQNEEGKSVYYAVETKPDEAGPAVA